MTESKVWFIMGAFAFIIFVVQMGALMGSSIIENAPPPATIPSGIADTIFTNFGYFFQLMTVSSSYAFVGLLLSILTLGMIWAIIELIRGV